jgi:hypothetical protein
MITGTASGMPGPPVKVTVMRVTGIGMSNIKFNLKLNC